MVKCAYFGISVGEWVNLESFLRSDNSDSHDGIYTTHLEGALLNEARDHTEGQRRPSVFHTAGIVQRPI